MEDLVDYELNLSTNYEPTSFAEANSNHEWKESMKKEYDASWKLVDPIFGTKPIDYKWVYKNKYKSNGSLDKNKA